MSLQSGMLKPGESLAMLPPMPTPAPRMANPMASQVLKGSAGSFAEVIADKDAITAVNQFCQRFSGKILSKEDIVYNVVRLKEGHQCTLKLDCLNGVEFAGEVCSNQKEARLSAAQQVLEMYAAEIASMPATTTKTKSKKRPASGGLGMPDAKIPRTDAAGNVVAPNQSNKGDLNTTYAKIIRRSTTASDKIIFSTNQVIGGFQSQVQLPGLPPPWNNEVWAGEVHAKKQDAEQSVAGVALAMITSDPALMAAHNKPPKPNQWLLNGGLQRAKGKDKGKGKGGGGSPSVGGSGGWDSAPSSGGMGAVSAAGGADAAVWQSMLAQQYAALGAMSGQSMLR